MRSSSDSLNARKVILKPRIVSLAVRVRAAAWRLRDGKARAIFLLLKLVNRP